MHGFNFSSTPCSLLVLSFSPFPELLKAISTLCRPDSFLSCCNSLGDLTETTAQKQRAGGRTDRHKETAV